MSGGMAGVLAGFFLSDWERRCGCYIDHGDVYRGRWDLQRRSLGLVDDQACAGPPMEQTH